MSHTQSMQPSEVTDSPLFGGNEVGLQLHVPWPCRLPKELISLASLGTSRMTKSLDEA